MKTDRFFKRCKCGEVMEVTDTFRNGIKHQKREEVKTLQHLIDIIRCIIEDLNLDVKLIKKEKHKDRQVEDDTLINYPIVNISNVSLDVDEILKNYLPRELSKEELSELSQDVKDYYFNFNENHVKCIREEGETDEDFIIRIRDTWNKKNIH